MSKKVDLYPDREYTFSSYVQAGDFIFTSHQGGVGGDVVSQLEAAFQSLKETLKAAGAGLDDVVKINLLLKDKEDFPPHQRRIPQGVQEQLPCQDHRHHGFCVRGHTRTDRCHRLFQTGK